MKLNHDCVRDLLICLEENLIVNNDGSPHFLYIDDIICFDNMKPYARADIIYCSQMLDEAGLICISIDYENGVLRVLGYNNMTFNGHQYLDNIRNNDVWNKVKEFINATGGSASFRAVTALAEKLVLHTI